MTNNPEHLSSQRAALERQLRHEEAKMRSETGAYAQLHYTAARRLRFKLDVLAMKERTA